MSAASFPSPATHPLGISLDGGGGALRWAAWRGTQQIASGSLPGAVLQLLGWPAYAERLTEAIHIASQHAEAGAHELQTLGMGLSGVDRPAEIDQIYTWVREKFPFVTQCWAGNDAWPALRAGVGKLHGILLIAGTGTVCLGAAHAVAGSLMHVRVGGWGGLLDDAGSGYWLGLQFVREAIRTADGRAHSKAILQRVMQTWEIDVPLNIIAYINKLDRSGQRASISALAPLVREFVEAGDPAAQKIVSAGAAAQAELITTCFRRLGEVAPVDRAHLPVIAHGGLVRHWPAYAAAIHAALDPALQFSVPEIDPLFGAFALAGEFKFRRL